RFDVNHPETNGMIEYFLLPMEGVSTGIRREDLAAYRSQPGMQFRAKPAGVVDGKIGEGTLALPAACEFVRPLTRSPLKFTVTSPYMLAKTVIDRHYHDSRALTMEIAEVLRRQVADIDAAVVQIDEANLTGNPEDAEWAFEPINHVLGAVRGEKAMHLCFGNYGGQTIQHRLLRNFISFFNKFDVGHPVLEFSDFGRGACGGSRR